MYVPSKSVDLRAGKLLLMCSVLSRLTLLLLLLLLQWHCLSVTG